MVLGRRELSVVLLAFGGIISVYMVLLAGPTSAQQGGGSSGGTTGGAQLSCSGNERIVETFTGTESQITLQFEITGREWNYAFRRTGGLVDVFQVEALDEGGVSVPFSTIFSSASETGRSGPIEGPGTFSLDIDADSTGSNLQYTVVVCDEASQGTSTPGSTSGVIQATIPQKPLPPTGGWPVYALVASSIFAGMGLLGIRIGIRRGQQGR